MTNTRLSTPFFLYADEEAVLDQAAARGRCSDGRARPAGAAWAAAQLAVVDFKLNVGNCRGSGHRRRILLRTGLGRDSDSFPGLRWSARWPTRTETSNLSQPPQPKQCEGSV